MMKDILRSDQGCQIAIMGDFLVAMPRIWLTNDCPQMNRIDVLPERKLLGEKQKVGFFAGKKINSHTTPFSHLVHLKLLAFSKIKPLPILHLQKIAAAFLREAKRKRLNSIMGTERQLES